MKLSNRFRLRILLIICHTFLYQSLYAQSKFTLSGIVKDKKNGETMIGVSIYPLEIKGVGTTCNEYGFYSLTLPAGSYHVIFSFIGYQSDTLVVQLNENKKIDRSLSDGSISVKEAVITAERKDDNITRTDMGVEKIDVKEIAKLPVIFGEKDVLKTIQLLPGVKSSGEGSSGFYVRGGSADQNLIMLDEAPIYNASHLLGFFSTFNSDALKDVTIIKGNSPAQYGGRLSSVLDVKMKEGNNQKHTVSGGIGLISSRISAEGPLVKDKGSYIISARRTYADVFLKLTEDFKNNSLYFYDFNAKFNYKINEKNRLFVSGYLGSDKLGVGAFGIDWGNKTATMRWNCLISPKIFSNTSLIYSNYNYKLSIASGESKLHIQSEIEDWTLKEEFQYFANSKNSIRFGFMSIYHTMVPNRFTGNVINEPQKKGRHSWDNALFINDVYELSDHLTLDAGVRLSLYSILGGDTYYQYNNGLLIDSVSLKAGDFGKTYINLEPRAQLNYRLNETSSIKMGYARNTQHVHLLSNSTVSSPTDQWIGNSYNVKPETADQISLGYFRNFKDNTYQASIEGYYKQMYHQIDYKNGADINSAPDIESELLYGKGRAYGVELLFKKTKGRLTGWIGYTLSKTERKIAGINEGEWYNAKQDRTHDLSIVAMYSLNDKWSLSGLFVYNTGNAVTFPSGKYDIGGNTVFYYAGRNRERMPANHRMDIGITYQPTIKKRWESSWNFSLYNVYGRQNAFSIAFEDDPNDPSRTRAVQTSLFRWVPSVTYNFKF